MGNSALQHVFGSDGYVMALTNAESDWYHGKFTWHNLDTDKRGNSEGLFASEDAFLSALVAWNRVAVQPRIIWDME